MRWRCGDWEDDELSFNPERDRRFELWELKFGCALCVVASLKG